MSTPITTTHERRDRLGRVEYRKLTGSETRKGNGRGKIVGYAAVFYDGTPETEFRLGPNLVERIMPGAFDRVLREGQNVVALFNHNRDHLLGRTAAGTLKLSSDKIGLRYEITVAQTTIGRDLLISLNRKDVEGSSFGFTIGRERIRSDGAKQIREIIEIDFLHDVGPVTSPAYEGTTANAAGVTGDGRTATPSVTDQVSGGVPIAIRMLQLKLRKRREEQERPSVADRMAELRKRRVEQRVLDELERNRILRRAKPLAVRRRELAARRRELGMI